MNEAIVTPDGKLLCSTPECKKPIEFMEETGYTRTWNVEMEGVDKLAAIYGGTDDFSEQGAGDDYLMCTDWHHSALPSVLEIDYR